MDNMAWHYNPVWPSDFFIRADLSCHGMPGRFEQLWVKKVGERQFQICCVPFFTYGIALGDTVQTDDEFTFQQVVAKGGHKTLRVVVAIKEKQDQLHETLHEWVDNTGLLYEWYSPGYLAVDLPPDAQGKLTFPTLEQLNEKGKISIEIDE
jgi:hypothetical protein